MARNSRRTRAAEDRRGIGVAREPSGAALTPWPGSIGRAERQGEATECGASARTDVSQAGVGCPILDRPAKTEILG